MAVFATFVCGAAPAGVCATAVTVSVVTTGAAPGVPAVGNFFLPLSLSNKLVTLVEAASANFSFLGLRTAGPVSAITLTESTAVFNPHCS